MDNKNEKDRKKTGVNFKKEQCPVCGSTILHMNKKRHERTRKHKEAQYLWHEQFEMK